MSVRVAVVSAGLSQPSTSRMLAEQIANAVSALVSARGEAVELEFVELRELAQELATTMVTGGLPTPAVAAARDVLARADALIAVSPTFTASYSGLFKMFFDVLDPDTLRNVPTIVGATAGTARHSLVLDFAMRPLFTYLHAMVVPTGVFAATEDFGGDDAASGLSGRVRQAANELVTLVMQSGSSVGGFVPSDDDLTRRVSGNRVGATPDFASLLKGHAGIL